MDLYLFLTLDGILMKGMLNMRILTIIRNWPAFDPDNKIGFWNMLGIKFHVIPKWPFQTLPT